MAKPHHEKGEYAKLGSDLLASLREDSIAILTDAGITTDAAEQIGNELTYRIANNWGGRLLYVGKGYEFASTARDRQIYAEFKGHNHSELAQKYKLTTPYIYRIVKRMLAAERNRLQPPLFPDEG